MVGRLEGGFRVVGVGFRLVGGGVWRVGVELRFVRVGFCLRKVGLSDVGFWVVMVVRMCSFVKVLVSWKDVELNGLIVYEVGVEKW